MEKEKIDVAISKGIPVMDVESLIKYIFEFENEVEKKEQAIKDAQQQVEDIKKDVALAKEVLLDAMKQDKREVIDTKFKLVAQFFTKNEFSYGDEKALLSKLQEMKLNQYIKTTTKTTTAIDKNTLKKDLKVNTKLKESLKDFVGDRLSEFVVVTTKENHKKMLEHIEEGKKK